MKVARAKTTLEHVRNLGQVYIENLGFRVNLFLVRGKNNCVAAGLELFTVIFEGSRILLKVFTLAELKAIDKDGCHNTWSLGASQVHKAQVTLVNIAHRWYARHGLFSGQPLSQIYYRLDDFHIRRRCPMAALPQKAAR